MSFSGWTLAEAKQKTVIASGPVEADTKLWSMLMDERLVAMGARQGSTTFGYLRPDHLKSLSKRDYHHSSAFNPAGVSTQAWNIRVYPVLLSNVAANILHGMALSSVFRRFILDDPEVELLSHTAREADPKFELVIDSARCYGAGLPYWPVRFAMGSLAGGLNHSLTWIYDEWRRPAPGVQAAADAICIRYQALLDLLRSATLVAHGDPVREHDPLLIMASLWSGKRYAIDAREGDLCSYNESEPHDVEEMYVPRWRSLELRRRDADKVQTLPIIEPAGSTPGSGGWQVVETSKALTTKERQLFEAVVELFPSGVSTFSTKERDRKLCEYISGQKLHAPGTSTIKRFFKKMTFS